MSTVVAWRYFARIAEETAVRAKKNKPQRTKYTTRRSNDTAALRRALFWWPFPHTRSAGWKELSSTHLASVMMEVHTEDWSWRSGIRAPMPPVLVRFPPAESPKPRTMFPYTVQINQYTAAAVASFRSFHLVSNVWRTSHSELPLVPSCCFQLWAYLFFKSHQEGS
jgi:hypothetical protein